MAIINRCGATHKFDPNKMLTAEWAFPDDGSAWYCVAPGNVKKVATIQELQALLDSSAEAYDSLQQAISNLGSNPSQLTSLLNTQADINNAKKGESTLSEKVGLIDSQFASIAKVYINVVKPPIPLVGAKGDGTDETSIIQNILNNYENVIFPVGTYRVTSLNIPASRTILGASKTNTQIISYTPNVNVINIGVDAHHVTIKNLHIAYGGNDKTTNGIYINYSQQDASNTNYDAHVVINEFLINNCNDGIYVSANTRVCRILNGVITGCVNGMRCFGTDDYISNVDVNNCTTGGFLIASNNLISNCKAWYCADYGFYFNGSHSIGTGLSSQNNQNGLGVAGNSNTLEFEIDGCGFFAAGSGNSIWITSGQHNILTGTVMNGYNKSGTIYYNQYALNIGGTNPTNNSVRITTRQNNLPGGNNYVDFNASTNRTICIGNSVNINNVDYRKVVTTSYLTNGSTLSIPTNAENVQINCLFTKADSTQVFQTMNLWRNPGTASQKYAFSYNEGAVNHFAIVLWNNYVVSLLSSFDNSKVSISIQYN